MKCKSAADLKEWHSRSNKIDLPRAGTKVKKVYDLFYANKGKIINPTLTIGEGREAIYYLVNFYGLDIRNFGHGKWCLVGEWFGKDYVDYIAEKIKPKVRRKP